MSRPAGSASSHRPLSASARLGISVLAGLAAGALVGFLAGVPLGVLTGIAAMGLAFVLIGTLVLWPMDADRTRANAIREDFNAGLEEIVVILAALGGLAGVVVLLIMDPRESGPYAGIMGLAGAFLTWAMVHLMYSSQYAYLYYTHRPEGGIDFNTSRPPCNADFFYFSFNVGTTYGVTDTSVSTTDLRAVVLRHSLLSYVFGTVILAVMINFVAGIFGG